LAQVVTLPGVVVVLGNKNLVKVDLVGGQAVAELEREGRLRMQPAVEAAAAISPALVAMAETGF
jgi:hypothetical protein